MKIIAWNVNGIRSLIKSNNIQQIFDEKPDVLCIGETKIDCNDYKDIDESDIFSYFKYRYWSHCSTKKGYAGTAIFSKKKPLNVFYGLINSNIDKEGRVITLEFKKVFNILEKSISYLQLIESQNKQEELQKSLNMQNEFSDYMAQEAEKTGRELLEQNFILNKINY